MRTDNLIHNRLSTTILIIAFAAVVLAASPLLAEEGEDWQPPPPMPEKFDWIMLKSGEWLKGKITAMYDEEFEFDSAELDDLTLDWADVKEVRSAGIMQIGFEHDVVASGQLLIEGDTVHVIGEEDQSFPRSDLLTITAGAPKEINNWSGKITVGANIREGNTEQTEFSSQATVKRRTPKSRITLDYLGNFNRTFGEVAADNQRVTVDWNRYISKRFFWTPASGEYYRDPFQNIGSRWSIGAGLGYTLVDTSKIDWEVTGTVGYQTTTFDSVLEGEDESADTPALVFGTVYDHKLTKQIDFIFDYSFFIVNEESGTYTHHFLTGLEFELGTLLDFDVTFVWDRVQDPRQNEDGSFPEQDDFRLTFGLGVDF
jgi:hypothetical protein